MPLNFSAAITFDGRRLWRGCLEVQWRCSDDSVEGGWRLARHGVEGRGWKDMEAISLSLKMTR